MDNYQSVWSGVIDMGVLPRVANVDFSRLKIEAGDRVIVRYYCDLDCKQRGKLRDAVSKWAGEDVRVLLVDVRKMDVQVEKVKAIR